MRHICVKNMLIAQEYCKQYTYINSLFRNIIYWLCIVNVLKIAWGAAPMDNLRHRLTQMHTDYTSEYLT